MMNKALYKAEEQFEKRHRQGQEGISWEHMTWCLGISMSRTLWFNVHEDKWTRLESKPWDSRQWHWTHIILDRRQVLKIWENYITGLYNWPNQPGNLEVELEEEVHADKKGSYTLQSEVKKTIKEMRDKKAAGDDDVPGYILLLLGEDGLRIMTQLIYNTYKTGEWLKISLKLQWLPKRRSQKLQNAVTTAQSASLSIQQR